MRWYRDRATYRTWDTPRVRIERVPSRERVRPYFEVYIDGHYRGREDLLWAAKEHAKRCYTWTLRDELSRVSDKD